MWRRFLRWLDIQLAWKAVKRSGFSCRLGGCTTTTWRNSLTGEERITKDYR